MLDLFDDANLEIIHRLSLALAIGAIIGLERSYHGRPAGFRTHALVCLSTCLLSLVTVFDARWMSDITAGRVTLDPTRMAQGIMTGIGFLGAGAIIRDGVSVRGLTTAASIWITAAIGVLIGIGFHFPAIVASLLTLGTLSIFQWIESRLPTKFFANFTVRFAPDAVMPEADLRRLIDGHGLRISNLHYRLDRAEQIYEYRMVLHARRGDRARPLAEALAKLDGLRAYQIAPTTD